jgi:CheY-like chemotaxis protein
MVVNDSGTVPDGIQWAVPGQMVLVADDKATIWMLIRDVLETMGCGALDVQEAHFGMEIVRSDKRVDLLVNDVCRAA